MVTVRERPNILEAQQDTGLINRRAEQDILDALNEYGAQPVEPEPEVTRRRFAYGIPMAGVRYYTFTGKE